MGGGSSVIGPKLNHHTTRIVTTRWRINLNSWICEFLCSIGLKGNSTRFRKGLIDLFRRSKKQFFCRHWNKLANYFFQEGSISSRRLIDSNVLTPSSLSVIGFEIVIFRVHKPLVSVFTNRFVAALIQVLPTVDVGLNGDYKSEVVWWKTKETWEGVPDRTPMVYDVELTLSRALVNGFIACWVSSVISRQWKVKTIREDIHRIHFHARWLCCMSESRYGSDDRWHLLRITPHHDGLRSCPVIKVVDNFAGGRCLLGVWR